MISGGTNSEPHTGFSPQASIDTPRFGTFSKSPSASGLLEEQTLTAKTNEMENLISTMVEMISKMSDEYKTQLVLRAHLQKLFPTPYAEMFPPDMGVKHVPEVAENLVDLLEQAMKSLNASPTLVPLTVFKMLELCISQGIF